MYAVKKLTQLIQLMPFFSVNFLFIFFFKSKIISKVDAQRGPSAKARIKSRVLTQIVTPGASTYVYDLCLRNEDIEFRDNQPVLGILYTAMAYSIIEVYVEERIVVL